MKKITLVLWVVLFYSYSCQSQVMSKVKKQNIEYFNIEKYKDWEIDSYYLQSENDKFLKKGNDRVRILIYDKTIQVEKKDINSPYKYYYLYDSKTKLLNSFGARYLSLGIGKWSYYDENGKLFKEVDTDKAYNFSISHLIEKFKNEYNLDLEDSKTVFGFNRYEEKEYLNIPIYEVGIKMNDISNTIEYYLVDGNNGKTLYSIKIAEGEIKSPLYEYIKQIKKEKQEDDGYIEYFNIEQYKDWEVDTDFFSSETSKSLKRGNDRVKIRLSKEDTFLRISSTLNQYTLYKSYFANKSLEAIGRKFYDFSIGIWKFYDEAGKLIKEVDNDIDYKFSLEQLIEKMQIEYDLDINKKTKRMLVRRWHAIELNSKPLYCVMFDLKDESYKWKYILIDGSTGETLFTTLFDFGDNEKLPPFYQYLENLEKQ